MIIIITYLVGLGGLTHIVAGSTVMFYAVATHMLSWSGYLTGFLIPVFLGNVLGGLALVAALAHGQVIGGKETPHDSAKK